MGCSCRQAWGEGPPDVWLQGLTGGPLSCSYHLSCQLEASGQWAGMKELLQFFRSHKI